MAKVPAIDAPPAPGAPAGLRGLAAFEVADVLTTPGGPTAWRLLAKAEAHVLATD